MSKENKIFSFVIGTVLVLILLAWFFKHPSSPYFPKKEYTFEFVDLGTLSEGAIVRVNGLALGEVTDVALTESRAQAKTIIHAKVEIPKDSKVRIFNVGLVGERILDIQLGRSEDVYSENEVISGVYDAGSVAIVVTATKAIVELSEIFYSVRGVLDSTIFHPQTAKTWKQIQVQAQALNRSILRLKNGSTEDFTQLFEGLDSLKANMKVMLAESQEGFGQLGESGSEMIQVGEQLTAQLGQLAQELEDLKALSENPESGFVYHMMRDPEFQSEMDSLVNSWQGINLMILNRSHILNVDVF